MKRLTNYYEVLGIDRHAAPAEVKRAYRRLAKQYHPDTNGGDMQTAERFKQVHEAYKILGTEESRAAYNAHLSEASGSGEAEEKPLKHKESVSFDPGNMEEQFERFFGFQPKGQSDRSNRIPKRSEAPKGMDTSDLFERYFGMRKK